MSKTYYSVLTTYGAQLFAQAMSNRRAVNITQFAVGDGGGRAVQPDSARTSLVRQVHRANVSAVSQDPRNNKQVIFELTIPETVGGFWIREMGIYDAQNRLVAYANCPDTYKPRLEEGSGKVQVMRMILLVSSSNAVTLTVDDSVIFATRGQLTPKTITASSQNGVDDTGHSHQIDRASTTQAGIVQLDSSTTSPSETKAATLKAVKTVKDLADSNTRSLQNVIPNSKKSNSVTSTSSDTVATSYAVKQAYDKGVSAQNTADSANRNADGRVSKSGDTMTGHLTINHKSAIVRFQRNGEHFGYIGFPGQDWEHLRFSSNKFNSWIQLEENKVLSPKPFYVNGNKVHHEGERYVAVTASNQEYGGLHITRSGSVGNWGARVEALPDKRWKFWVQNSHDIYLPAKGGTVILDRDFSQNLGDTGWYKLPNGIIKQWVSMEKATSIESSYNRYRFNFPVAVRKVLNIGYAIIDNSNTRFKQGEIQLLTTSGCDVIVSSSARTDVKVILFIEGIA